MFLLHGLWLTAAGIALGIGIAPALTRVMSALLFGVGPIAVQARLVVYATRGNAKRA